MDDTTNLKLPYILAAQSQKHVTHNEALRALDALVQLSVADKDLAAPPGSPAEGDRYIVAASATGAWAGHDGEIAAFQDGAWAFYDPLEGWLAWVADEDEIFVFNGASWIPMPASGGGGVNPVSLVGVNATADATNRLSVSSPASLFNHEGAGHQIKINKYAAANTASVLFQSGFSGRAEFGLAGDDDFHVKVSADGSTWNEAFVISNAAGIVIAKKFAMGGGTPVTIAGGVATITTAKVVLDTEGAAATDDLDTITMSGVLDGTLIIVGTLTSSRDVTLKHGTGNMVLPSAADIALTASGLRVLMQYQANNSTWYAIAKNF